MRKWLSVFFVFILCACGSGPAEGTIYGPFYQTGTSTLIIVVTSSRTSCTAPCPIFFDATGSTSTTTSQPYREIYYSWNFGDSGAALWSTGSTLAGQTLNSSNVATGGTAAHVFNTAGTYNVTISGTDGTSTVTNQAVATITVADPNTTYATTNTICFANAVSPTWTGCPSGATHVASSTDFTTAINTYCAAGKRLLFNRGDTWTTPANATNATCAFSGSGVQIGDFGSGALPVVNSSYTGSGNLLNLSSCATYTMDDVSIYNLNFTATAGNGATAIGTSGEVTDLLIQGNTINTYGGAAISSGVAGILDTCKASFPSTAIWKNIFVVNNTMGNSDPSNSAVSVYFWAENFAVMGNSMQTTNAGYWTNRLPYIYKGVISNNNYLGAGATKDQLKIHAPLYTAGATCATGVAYCHGGFTEYVEISDNYFGHIGGQTMLLANGNNDDERGYYIVVERNYFQQNHGSASSCIGTVWYSITYRDNVFNMVTATGLDQSRWAISINDNNAVPPDDQVIYNNTMWTNDTPLSVGSMEPIFVAADATNTVARNNVIYAPNMTGGAGTLIQTGTATTSNNSTNFTTDPLFINGTGLFSTIPDFKINTGSYAIAGGTNVPVWYDAVGVAWSPTWDMGAIHH